MTTADQLAIVESFLADATVKATALAEGGLVQGWMKARRLLVVVQKAHTTSNNPSSSAIFIFLVSAFPVSAPNDLTLESVMKVDSEFRCEIDSGEAVLLKFSNAKKKLMFEMLPGFHTQNFVAEVYRLQEASAKMDSSDFSWVDQHLPSQASSAVPQAEKAIDALSLEEKGAKDSNLLVDMDDATNDSPDDSINRHDVAMGVTPIAARESVVKYQMAMKEAQFTNIQTFNIFVGTWNVNGQSPTESLADWLAVDDEAPDLYVIGFQELDLSKEAFIFNESLKEAEWLTAVTLALHPKAKYKRVGMMLLVFVKADHAPFIQGVSAETVGTGIMGKLGNKGGVAVRIEFHNTSICFVNSHLAAHVSEFERRNQDYHDVCNRMYFQNFSPPKGIKDHDMVFWLGDLNYRITDLDAQSVKELLKEKKFEDLLKFDQFQQQRLKKKAFSGYNEGQITFLPTYKFDTGTDNWDSSEKCRIPAWTDRILWKGDHIEQKDYRSHMELRVSDHKPVSAIFTAGMKVVDPAKYRKIYEDVMKRLDRLENEFLPQVTVDTTEINFDTIKFLEPYTQTLTIANTGQVPVQFEFIKKLNDTNFCKSWLTVEPCSGFIMPGDKSDINLEVFVDKKTAGPLTCGHDQMYDILVLHLVNGKDIFVTVSGTYQKSCFGASINALCRMTVPISELSPGEVVDYERDDSKAGRIEDPYPVPKELWFLCDLITSLGLESENMFFTAGLRSEILEIRDWLDTGIPVDKPKVAIHSAVEALLLFLESLREPIVPHSYFSRSIEASPNYLQCKQIVSQLPLHHKLVFNYVTAFLREVVRHSAKNGSDPKILSTLFASIVLQDPPGISVASGLRARPQQQALDTKKAKFVYHFLVNEPDD